MKERKRDEYGREVYGDREVPPPTARLAVWRGGLTIGGPPSLGTGTSLAHGPNPYGAKCEHGWVGSRGGAGLWWLHCLDCRPPEPKP